MQIAMLPFLLLLQTLLDCPLWRGTGHESTTTYVKSVQLKTEGQKESTKSVLLPSCSHTNSQGKGLWKHGRCTIVEGDVVNGP